MNREGYLFGKIVNLENLYSAEKKAGIGKSKNKEVVKFRESLDHNLNQLYNELINIEYKVSKYYNFTLYEKKERKISKLPYRDRVVHHAVMINLEDIFTKCFISQTYSCIRTRGIHRCLNTLTQYLRRGGGLNIA